MGKQKAFSLVLRGWRQLLANRGVLAAARVLGHGIVRRLVRRLVRRPDIASEPAIELWRNAGAIPSPVHPFDAEFGTATGGLVWGEDLVTGHRHDAWNTAYYGIAPSAFAAALAGLLQRARLDPARFTFIDLGSGKGRAVLLASQFNFAAVLGVELAPQLYTAALANLATFSATAHVSPGVQMLNADAADFPWGRALIGPLVFFLYNPFARPVLAKFLDRLRTWLQAGPCEVYLLYINPDLDGELTRRGWIEKLWQETIAIGEADQLGDRFGSTTEEVAAYRCHFS